jgi:hypothetical protein
LVKDSNDLNYRTQSVKMNLTGKIQLVNVIHDFDRSNTIGQNQLIGQIGNQSKSINHRMQYHDIDLG